MKPHLLARELHTMQKIAINALGVIPKQSFYRTWSYQLIAEELPAHRYPKLRERLLKFVQKNNLEERFNLLAN